MRLETGCNRSRSLVEQSWAAIIILIVMLPSFYWIANDHHVWPWDPAWYGEGSVDLWFRLTRRFSKWTPAMLNAFGSKSPGIAWFGQFFVPLGRAVGSIETGLLCSIIATQIGSVALFYNTAKELAPGRGLVAAAGVLLLASAPLFVAMSHQYFPEPLQLFGVTYFYFLAAAGHRMHRLTLLGNLLLATAIALLAKMTSPIYCGLPGLIAAYALFQRRDAGNQAPPGGARWRWLVVFAGALLCVACAAWYSRNLSALRGTLKLQTSLEFTSDYGRPGTFLEKFSYWLHAFQWSFQLPWVIVGQLALAGGGLAFAKIWARAGENKPLEADEWRFNLLAISSVLHILTVLSLCALNYNEENRYLLPLLPAVATINLWIISKIRQPWLLAGVILLLVSQWIAVCSQSMGWMHLEARACSYWLVPFDNDGVRANEVARIVHDTFNPVAKSRFSIVGVELPWLNATTLSFFAAKAQFKTGKRSYYSSLGYKENDAEAAWARIQDPKYQYFISLDETTQPASANFLNEASIPVLRRIRDDSGFIRQPFSSTLGVVIYRKNAENPKFERPGTGL
jgi:hypothetical protein